MYFISDSAMLKHFCPWESYHIEVPKRLEVIQDTMEKFLSLPKVEQLRPRSATKEEVEMVHTSHYISQIASTVNMDVEELEDFSSKFEDIYVNNETFDASLLAAGCVMELVDAVTRTGNPGFAAVRPPGHHAFPDKGCGFCIFNNVALAAKHALKRERASRVLIVDWDVHAGQGTQECISDDERIRLVSIHRFERGKFWPNLPQSAVKNEFQNTINVPLNDIGMTDSDFLGIFQLVVHPVINDFEPDLIIVSCGFDAALGDPEGEMRLTPAGYATLTQQLLTRGIPLAMILEGGYFLDSIAADFEWVVKALLGYAIPCVNVEPLNPALRPVINKIFDVFGTSYPTLRLLQTIGQRLTPRDDAEKNYVEEYEGTRDFPIPFPTRGLYSERCADVTSRLKKELQNIIASYSKESQYKFVRYDCTDVDLPFAYMNSADTISLEISAETKGIVHHLISQTINPLLPSLAYEPSISASDLSRVVELIRNISSISGLPSLHITQL